jgi:uncharacterized protein
MRVLLSESYAAMPWKNGGGITREIARSDGHAAPGWRISLATIDRDGPFSAFPGYDRTIVPLEGAGFVLVFAQGNSVSEVALDRRYEPFAFSGERPVDCRLIAGPSRDLNVMTRRETWSHGVTHMRLTTEHRLVDASQPCFLFVLEGEVRVAGAGQTLELRANDTLLCPAASPFEASAPAGGAQALLIELQARSTA